MKSNRFVVITGAAGGIGSLLADRFFAKGNTVLATDTSADALAVIVKPLRMWASDSVLVRTGYSIAAYEGKVLIDDAPKMQLYDRKGGNDTYGAAQPYRLRLRERLHYEAPVERQVNYFGREPATVQG